MNSDAGYINVGVAYLKNNIHTGVGNNQPFLYYPSVRQGAVGSPEVFYVGIQPAVGGISM